MYSSKNRVKIFYKLKIGKEKVLKSEQTKQIAIDTPAVPEQVIALALLFW